LLPVCRLGVDTDRLKVEAMRRLKGEAEGEGQRRKVAVSVPRCRLARAVRLPHLAGLVSSCSRRSTSGCADSLASSCALVPLQSASERSKKEGSSALEEFCRDLCKEAASQRVDPVSCRRELPLMPSPAVFSM
jgi:hypothetical protein